jgi:dipeptidyl-peptidase-3
MDSNKIKSVGKPAIAKFLGRIQLYKSIADYKSAKEMFDKYTAVTSESKYPFLNYREIIMERKKPRKLFVQPNTVLEGLSNVVLKNYEDTAESMIKSWVDRFQDAKIYSILEELWEKDRPYF